MAEYEDQKKAKPSLEQTLECCKNDTMKEETLEFAQFLLSNKMKPQWGAKNSYNVSFKSRRVCIIKINENGFEIRANTQYNDDFNECFSGESESMKKLLLDSVTYCFGCGTCKPGLDVEMLGKKLTGACFNPVIKFENPDREQLELAKKLVLLRKKAIAEDKAPRVTYIAMSKR